MGRFIAVVIVLVAIALLINRYLGKEEAPQPDEPATQEQPEVDVEEPAAPTADEGETPAPPASATPDVLIPEEQPTPGAEDAAEEAEDAAEEAASRGTGDVLLRIPGEGDLPLEQIEA